MSVNFIFLIIGLLVSSVVPPLAFMLTWPKVRPDLALSTLGSAGSGLEQRPSIVHMHDGHVTPKEGEGLTCGLVTCIGRQREGHMFDIAGLPAPRLP